jgi:hypothetical protein
LFGAHTRGNPWKPPLRTRTLLMAAPFGGPSVTKPPRTMASVQTPLEQTTLAPQVASFTQEPCALHVRGVRASRQSFSCGRQVTQAPWKQTLRPGCVHADPRTQLPLTHERGVPSVSQSRSPAAQIALVPPLPPVAELPPAPEEPALPEVPAEPPVAALPPEPPAPEEPALPLTPLLPLEPESPPIAPTPELPPVSAICTVRSSAPHALEASHPAPIATARSQVLTRCASQGA